LKHGAMDGSFIANAVQGILRDGRSFEKWFSTEKNGLNSAWKGKRV
jgi:hypothetical protein